MTSSPHGPYRLGYTRATMAVTMGSEGATWRESLVIVDQHATVNTFPGLVHTARHTMGVGFTRRRRANRKEAGDHGRLSDWGEVVTR